MDKTSMFVKIH